MIIMRNYLQSSNVTNCSKTAGKYMISAVGPLKERLKKEKWLSKEETFIMANFFNMEATKALKVLRHSKKFLK